MEAKAKDAAARRQRLHRLVDDMHEGELETVELFVDFVHERGDPVLRALMNAPYDDEPVTDEERTAVQEGLDALEAGDVHTLEDIEKEARALSWAIQVTGPAKRDLKRLDAQTRDRVLKALRRLAGTDYGDVARLKGEDPPQWRLRIGEWRVLFVYHHAERMISVVRVLPRGKAYDR